MKGYNRKITLLLILPLLFLFVFIMFWHIFQVPAGASGIGELSAGIETGTISTEYTPPDDGPVIGRVTAQYKLNVRKSPWGEIIDGFYPDTKVDILGVVGEWYKIRYGSGMAYVHTSLVAVLSGTPRSLVQDVEFPAYGITIARYSLNVRSAPWGEIIDGYRLGTEVEITGREGDWYIIKYGGGKAYVHTTLVIIRDKNNNKIIGASDNSTGAASLSAQNNAGPANRISDSNVSNNSDGPSDNASKTIASGGINGPGIPPELLQGIEAAKRTQWYTTPNKCLQFAGTIAHEAGAPDAGKTYTQPQSIWPPDKRLRGYYINQLSEAVESGNLLPGMLIHVKVHYDYDPAYNPVNDAHHWFVYVGKDAEGVPRFADNVHGSDLQTAQQVYNYMNGGSAKKYGDAKYGYNRRVHAVFDPFASVR